MKNYGDAMYEAHDAFRPKMDAVSRHWRDKLSERVRSKYVTPFEDKARTLAYKTKNLCAKITAQMQEMEALMQDL